MKKRVGMLYGKPIITGDENLCTKNEIHINSLKGGGESVQNKSIIKQYYYKVHNSSLSSDNWVLKLVNGDPRIGYGEGGTGIVVAYHLTKMTYYGTDSLLYKPGSIEDDSSDSESYEPVIYNDYVYLIVYYNPMLITTDLRFPEYPEDFKEFLKLYGGGDDYPIEDIDVLEEFSYEEHMEAWNYAVEKFKEEHKNE